MRRNTAAWIVCTVFLAMALFFSSGPLLASEQSITIDNPHSYPLVGSEWTVYFHTTGIGTLEIDDHSFPDEVSFKGLYAFDDGKWVQVPANVDADLISASWRHSEGKAVFVPKTAGEHILLFRFGNEIEAHNYAWEEWWNATWHYRRNVTVHTDIYNRTDWPVELTVNFTQLLADMNVSEPRTFDINSTRLLEYNATTGQAIVYNVSLGDYRQFEVPSQFDPGEGYNNSTNANGTFTWILNGTNPAYAPFVDDFEDWVGVPPMPVDWNKTPTVTVDDDTLKTQGTYSAKVDYSDGADGDFYKTYASPQDWTSYKYFQIDVFLSALTSKSLIIKIMDDVGTEIYNNSTSIPVIEWTTVKLDMSDWNHTALAQVKEVHLYVEDSEIPVGGLLYYYDNARIVGNETYGKWYYYLYFDILENEPNKTLPDYYPSDIEYNNIPQTNNTSQTFWLNNSKLKIGVDTDRKDNTSGIYYAETNNTPIHNASSEADPTVEYTKYYNESEGYFMYDFRNNSTLISDGPVKKIVELSGKEAGWADPDNKTGNASMTKRYIFYDHGQWLKIQQIFTSNASSQIQRNMSDPTALFLKRITLTSADTDDPFSWASTYKHPAAGFPYMGAGVIDIGQTGTPTRKYRADEDATGNIGIRLDECSINPGESISETAAVYFYGNSSFQPTEELRNRLMDDVSIDVGDPEPWVIHQQPHTESYYNRNETANITTNITLDSHNLSYSVNATLDAGTWNDTADDINLTLYDDGNHSDGNASDGIYGINFTFGISNKTGPWNLTVRIYDNTSYRYLLNSTTWQFNLTDEYWVNVTDIVPSTIPYTGALPHVVTGVLTDVNVTVINYRNNTPIPGIATGNLSCTINTTPVTNITNLTAYYNGTYTINFTAPSKVGTWNITCNPDKDNNTGSDWAEFETETPTTNVTTELLPNTSIVSNITQYVNKSFEMNVTLNNTLNGTAYATNITIDLPKDLPVSSDWSANISIYQNVGNLTFPTGRDWNISLNVTVPVLTPPGNYNITVTTNWTDPNGSPNTSNDTSNITVESNPILNISTTLVNGTVHHNTTINIGNFTVNSTGNYQLENINFTHSQTGNLPEGWVNFSPANISQLDAGNTTQVDVLISVPVGQANGTYNSTYRVNATSTNCTSSEKCWKELNISVVVPENRSWTISSTLDATEYANTNESGTFGTITVYNKGNLNISFNISDSGTGADMVSESNTSFTLQKENATNNQTTFFVNYTIPENKSHVIYNVTIFVNATTSGADPNKTVDFSIQVWDDIKPDLTNFSINTTVLDANYEQITIKANVTDNVNISKVWAYIGRGNGTYEENTSTMKSAGNDTYAYQYNYTPITGGLHNVTVYANDTNGTANINHTITESFTVIWTINVTTDLVSNTTNVSGITVTQNQTFEMNVTCSNNNANGTARWPNVTVLLPGGWHHNLTPPSDNFTKDYTNITAEGSNITYFNVTVPANETPGDYTINATCNWTDPSMLFNTSSDPVIITVESNPILTITEGYIPITVGHGSFNNTTNFTVESTGNWWLNGTNFTCDSGELCTDSNFNITFDPSSMINIPANNTIVIKVNISVNPGTPPKIYNGTILANATGTECNTSISRCNDTIAINVTVLESPTWNLTHGNCTRDLSNPLSGDSDGTLCEVQITNTGNVPLDINITDHNVSVPGTHHWTKTNETDFTVPARTKDNLTTYNFSIYHNTSTEVGVFVVNYTINVTNIVGIPPYINVTVNITIIYGPDAVNLTVIPNKTQQIVPINLSVDIWDNSKWGIDWVTATITTPGGKVDSILMNNSTPGTYPSNKTHWTATYLNTTQRGDYKVEIDPKDKQGGYGHNESSFTIYAKLNLSEVKPLADKYEQGDDGTFNIYVDDHNLPSDPISGANVSIWIKDSDGWVILNETYTTGANGKVEPRPTFQISSEALLGQYNWSANATYNDTIGKNSSVIGNKTGSFEVVEKITGLPLYLELDAGDEYHPGEQAVIYAVVKDQHGAMISTANVTLNITDPDGNTTQINAAPTAGNMYKAAFNNTTFTGDYLVTATATYNGHQANSADIFTVSPSAGGRLPLTLEIDAGYSYSPGDTVLIYATVKDRDGNMVPSATVNLNISDPNGNTTQVTASPTVGDMYKAQFNQTSTTGDYVVTGNATYGGYNATDADIFTVSDRLYATVETSVVWYPNSVMKFFILVYDSKGTLTDPDNMTLTTYNPADSLYFTVNMGNMTRKSTGYYTYSYAMPITTAEGMYLAELTVTRSGVEANDLTIFRVSSGGPYDLYFDIINPEVPRGEDLQYNLTLENYGDVAQDVYVSCWISDASGTNYSMELNVPHYVDPWAKRSILKNLSIWSDQPMGTYNLTCEGYYSAIQPPLGPVTQSFKVVAPIPTPTPPPAVGGGPGEVSPILPPTPAPTPVPNPELSIVSYPSEINVIRRHTYYTIIRLENTGNVPLHNITARLENIPMEWYTMEGDEEVLGVAESMDMLLSMRPPNEAEVRVYSALITAVSNESEDYKPMTIRVFESRESLLWWFYDITVEILNDIKQKAIDARERDLNVTVVMQHLDDATSTLTIAKVQLEAKKFDEAYNTIKQAEFHIGKASYLLTTLEYQPLEIIIPWVQIASIILVLAMVSVIALWVRRTAKSLDGLISVLRLREFRVREKAARVTMTKEELKGMLDTLRDQYERGIISEKVYRELRERREEELFKHALRREK